MIIDTSALLAVLFREPLGVSVIAAIRGDANPASGAPTLFEAEMVVSSRRGARGVKALRQLLEELGVVELPFAPAHRRAATEAFIAYGKGRHPARLNLGDCLTYAIAKVEAEPLLCVGGDFARTDLKLVALG